MEEINQGSERSADTLARKAAWPAIRQAREDKKNARLRRLRSADHAQLLQWIEDELA